MTISCPINVYDCFYWGICFSRIRNAIKMFYIHIIIETKMKNSGKTWKHYEQELHFCREKPRLLLTHSWQINNLSGWCAVLERARILLPWFGSNSPFPEVLGESSQLKYLFRQVRPLTTGLDTTRHHCELRVFHIFPKHTSILDTNQIWNDKLT